MIIIGGGAAGLMAATSSAARGRRVLLLEKNRKLGVKILMSGGTRCNITHNCGVREIVAAFNQHGGKQGKFLHSALSSLPPEEVIAKIEAAGVATKVEHTGKIFPVSNKAIDVRDALVNMATAAGATLASGQAVQAISFDPSSPRHNSGAVAFSNSSSSENGHRPITRFTVHSDQGDYFAANLIVTTGGKSYPGCGTTGDGYGWAENFGHTITRTVPALVPILNDAAWANDLKGITIEDAAVDVWQPEIESEPLGELSKSERKKFRAKSIAHRAGSFLFTHWGFSGPAVLDVSREVALHEQKKSLSLVCDFYPAVTEAAFESQLLAKKSAAGKQAVGGLLNDLFPKRLGEALIASADVDLSRRVAELSKANMTAITRQVKSCRFQINGTLGFEKAEVTAGGVALNEIDSRSMESKFCPGLFFAGEILDLDGPIGGFNFQSAFSTGWLAGQSV